MKYFTLKELTRSAIATEHGVDNSPSEDHLANLTMLVDNVLDPVRQMWQSPIYVSSGYRSKALNDKMRELGKHASKTSYHMKGLAADITTKNKLYNKSLFRMIIDSNIPFRQIINENNYTWIHISYEPGNAKREVLDGVDGVYSIHK